MRCSHATSSGLGILKSSAVSETKSCTTTKLHVAKKWILSEYAITAWDEFEGILSGPTNVPAVILDLRRHFHPFELWMGIGVGQVSEPYRKPVNVYAGGEAFERAREAMNRLKAKRSKTGILTSFVTGNETFDLISNTFTTCMILCCKTSLRSSGKRLTFTWRPAGRTSRRRSCA